MTFSAGMGSRANRTPQTNQKPLINKEKTQTMKPSIKFKTTSLLLIPLALACFALLPRAQAATPELLPAPAPDGAYTGFNTAEGLNALFNVNIAVGQFNTAVGFAALKFDTSGAHNTAVGGQALLNNNGSFNTAVGENALVHNTSGSMNMALGQGALANNTAGSSNTAIGAGALFTNNPAAAGTGRNTAVGAGALFLNTTGVSNNAVGDQALRNNIAGSFNQAMGVNAALQNNGSGNIAIGDVTLFNALSADFNTVVGHVAGVNLTSNNNTLIGAGAGAALTGGGGNICIGAGVNGHAGESGFIRIANNNLPEPPIVMANFSKVLIGGIHDTAITNLTNRTVQVNAAGQLAGIVVSSARYKKDVEPMDKASESILALRPVTFHYKEDKTNKLCFGLIAEEVAKVDPALVELDKEGKPLGVRYDDIPIRLLNEFLKEHKKVEEQQASITAQQATIAELKSTVAQQQKGMEVLTAQLDQQAAQIQKVRADLEASKPAPQVVNNP